MHRGLGAVVFALLGVASAAAYLPTGRWSETASGITGTQGTPITLTWSLIPDGTPIRGTGPSNLIARFDELFQVFSPPESLPQRSWFPFFDAAFQRWSQVGGIHFVYEPHDDGAEAPDAPGVLGVRGDVRIGGTYLDGPLGTLANSTLPNGGDVFLDTADTAFFGLSDGNHLQLRNVLMHELGHALGLLHIVSSTDELLMEPVLSTLIDGPQLDDIRGIHWHYGDALEKTNNGLGNNTPSTATHLGLLSPGGGLTVGTSAARGHGQFVAPHETDFVSISRSADIDVYSFSIHTPIVLDIMLSPLGGVFRQGEVGGTEVLFDANARNNLSLALYANDGTTLIQAANNAPAGQVEYLSDISLSAPGTYFVFVTGASIHVQLYQLQLFAEPSPPVLPGDFNLDDVVDAADYVLWRSLLGRSGAGLLADTNGDGMVDAEDLQPWRANFGLSRSAATTQSAANTTIPEPRSATFLWLLGIACGAGHRCAVRIRQ